MIDIREMAFGFVRDRQTVHFCLSANGQQNSDCLANFSGSLAIARYHVRPRAKPRNFLALRERVRTIDQDSRARASVLHLNAQ